MNKRTKRRTKKLNNMKKALELYEQDKSPSHVQKVIPCKTELSKKRLRNKYLLKAHPELKDEVDRLQNSSHPKETSFRKKQKKPASITDKLKEKLRGGQFRFLSEQFYKSTSEQAINYFSTANRLESYYSMYMEQLKKWSCDPLEWVVQWIKTNHYHGNIVDLGCGLVPRLAQMLNYSVRSFDIVENENVEKCNHSQPLPIENETIDVCVFCLSLMSVDCGKSIIQANRILKQDKFLIVVELSSRLPKQMRHPEAPFLKSVEGMGFAAVKVDVGQYFCNFVFKKVGKPVRKLKRLPLNPCLYNKR